MEKIQIAENITAQIINDSIGVKIGNAKKLAFVDYSNEMLELIKNARFRVPNTPEKYESYKYPYSNEYNKKLHQMVFDFYFGEEFRKDAYDKGYIIEHLDNDGFNCTISNLFLLKKIKNTYKGWHFDKVSDEAKLIASMKIFHVLKNRSFQITLGFNETFLQKSTGKSLSSVRLLYPYNYEIVLQDAEQIIESIMRKDSINFDKWKDIYRFKDIRVEFSPELELTEEEKNQKAGTLIIRDGQYYMLIGRTENSIGLIDTVPYAKDWDIE